MFSRSRDVCRAKAFLFCLAPLPVPPLRGRPCGRANTSVVWPTHTQAVLRRLRVSRAAATREVPMRGVPRIPSQRWRTSAHTDNLHISGKSSTRCLSSLTRQAGETARRAAPLKPDFYEAVNRSAVRGVCCLAVGANARNRLCCQNGPREIRTTPHQERGGWV